MTASDPERSILSSRVDAAAGAARVARCGFTIIVDGEEEPCDRETSGWRWYQGHDHEDMLDEACWEHENVGGNRMHAAEVRVAELRADVERLDAHYIDWQRTLQDEYRKAAETWDRQRARMTAERADNRARAESAESRLDALVSDLRGLADECDRAADGHDAAGRRYFDRGQQAESIACSATATATRNAAIAVRTVLDKHAGEQAQGGDGS
jgi:chromosome segregation ATPase